MPPEHSPALGTAPDSGTAMPELPPAETGGAYLPDEFWFALIDEKEAGRFLDLGVRTMQKYRQNGNGPKFVRLSGRCVKYRRFDCNVWNESRLRASTSDPGPDAAAA